MSPISILIVEDDAIVAIHMQNMLKNLGYHVIGPVATGEAAVTAEPSNLILMDILLAGEMDGITTARKIREENDIPIIFLTSYSQDPLIKEAKATAAYGYLLKPVSERELAATIEMVLNRHALDCQAKKHKADLQKAHDDLELRVDERTNELLQVNRSLRHEISERKHVEEFLFNSKATLTSIFDGISDPLLMVGVDSKIKRLNKSARDYFGLTHYQEAIGKSCFEEFRGISGPCNGCEVFSGSLGYPRSFERKGFTDPDRIEQVFVDMVKDESGAAQSYIIRIADVTHSRIMDRKLKQSEKLASLGLLVAGIAHEVNNPNNFIYFNIPILRSYLEFILPFADEYAEQNPDLQAFGRPYADFREDCFKMLDNIGHGSTRINEIVSNLREFVYEHRNGEMRPINLQQVVEKAISICAGRIKKTIRTFITEIPEDLPEMRSDPSAIEQVVVNLLINAVQAADKDDSQIELAVSQLQDDKAGMLINIRDNGCGMDEATQRKIFDPFFTTKAVDIGTGLGLSISHRLVSELGGNIVIQSELGKGSTFRVELPIQSPDNRIKG